MSIVKPNTTQTPNVIFDELLPLMKEAELRVTLVIARKTFGWHKEEDELSLSQLMKLTGMKKQGVLNGIEDGMKRGTIKRREKGQGFLYSLVVDEVDQSTNQTSPLSGHALVHQVDQQPVHEVDTQKKPTKETIQKKDSASGAGETPPPPPEPEKPQLHKHPAVQAFREIAHRYPAQAWYQDIVDTVGEDVEKWRGIVKEWIGLGYKPTNIKGMLDVFRDGWSSPGRSGNGNGPAGMPGTIPKGMEKQNRSDIKDANAEWTQTVIKAALAAKREAAEKAAQKERENEPHKNAA